MKYRILGYPNKNLRKKAREIVDITSRRKRKIKTMFSLMHESNGIGLAAPQIGWNARVFVMNITGDPSDDIVFINPTIVEQSGEPYEAPEGCLSIPDVVGLVIRNRKVVVTALDIDGKSFKIEDDDSMVGRCMLHEIDHLDGILFIDRTEKLYKSVK